jgi:16S rRNA (uracil1498-N3)-methyltransferase
MTDSARRFFVEGTREVGDVVEIDGSDAHKITHVLRLHAGDGVEIVDSAANAFAAALDAAGERPVRARLLAMLPPDASRGMLRVDVAQAVPKGRRMEFVIEKGTELGAGAFLPFYCERSVARAGGSEKFERWRRLARAAAQQCGRRDVPEIAEALEFDRLLERFTAYDRVLFAWELAEREPLVSRLRSTLPSRGRVLVVIGPEGGFTHREADAAAQCGAATISLGSRILRTDTAAMAVLAVIDALAS